MNPRGYHTEERDGRGVGLRVGNFDGDFVGGLELGVLEGGRVPGVRSHFEAILPKVHGDKLTDAKPAVTKRSL